MTHKMLLCTAYISTLTDREQRVKEKPVFVSTSHSHWLTLSWRETSTYKGAKEQKCLYFHCIIFVIFFLWYPRGVGHSGFFLCCSRKARFSGFAGIRFCPRTSWDHPGMFLLLSDSPETRRFKEVGTFECLLVWVWVWMCLSRCASHCDRLPASVYWDSIQHQVTLNRLSGLERDGWLTR